MYPSIFQEIRSQYDLVHGSPILSERLTKNNHINGHINMPWLSFIMILVSVPLASAILSSDNVWVQIPCAIGAILVALGGFVVYFNFMRYRHANHFYNEEIIVRDLVLTSYISMALKSAESEEDRKAVVDGVSMAYANARKIIADEKFK